MPPRRIKQKSQPPLLHGQQRLPFARRAKRQQPEEQPQEQQQQQQQQVLEHVQEQQNMKERRKQQNRCESCFEDNQLIFLAPFGCSTICRDCAMQISLCPSIGCGKEITRICSTRGELETAVTQLEERAARRKRQRKNRLASWRREQDSDEDGEKEEEEWDETGEKEEEEQEEQEEQEEEDGEGTFLKSGEDYLLGRISNSRIRIKRPKKALRLFESECICRDDDEDDDEEDDDDGGSLSDDFLVDDHEEIEYEVDGDLDDTHGDEREGVAFRARVNREMDRIAGEEEEEPPDEEEDPDDDPTEAETMAVPMTPQANKKNARAVAVEFVGGMVSPESGTPLRDVFKHQFPRSGALYFDGVSIRTGRLHARAMPTGDKAADEQSRKAANAKRRDMSYNLFETDDRKERRLRKKKRQMESSGSAEKKEEAKKEASRASSQKHREKQAPEEKRRA